MLENIVPRKKFGPNLDEVRGDSSDLYSSPNNVRVIKSRRMRWAGHVSF